MGIDKIIHVLKKHGKLSKADVFDCANLKMTESNVAIFDVLVENGRILKEGVRRGTKYFLAQEEEKPDATLEQQIIAVLESKQSFVTTELEEKLATPVHLIREALRGLMEQGKIEAHGERRGRFYTKPGAVLTACDDGTEDLTVSVNSDLRNKILAFFKQKKRNIVLNTLREQFPQEADHVIRGCLNELIAMDCIQKIGERRATVYSLVGEKQDVLVNQTMEEAHDFIPKLRDFINTRRVLRPAVIANHFIKDKKLVHIAINKLADLGQVKVVGEKRGKMVATLDASEDEIAVAREEQQTIVEIVDKFTALIADGKTFAVTQKVPEKIFVKIRTNFLNEVSKTEFTSYAEFQRYITSLLEVVD